MSTRPSVQSLAEQLPAQAHDIRARCLQWVTWAAWKPGEKDVAHTRETQEAIYGFVARLMALALLLGEEADAVEATLQAQPELVEAAQDELAGAEG